MYSSLYSERLATAIRQGHRCLSTVLAKERSSMLSERVFTCQMNGEATRRAFQLRGKSRQHWACGCKVGIYLGIMEDRRQHREFSPPVYFAVFIYF
eukprot:m.24582 g.24582  ORF g.24582 m.24582 type:complete len:96 (-) comp9705_c0_seq2:33-320(-)